MSRHVVALVGLCALTFLAGLGRPAITDSDEAFYAESAREMVERGDWLTPYYNADPRFEKPVLYYWMAAVAFLPAGPSPAAARLPAALAGVGLVFVAFLAARRWYDGATPLAAGVITATSFGAIAMARQALPDLPLALAVTTCVWASIVGLLAAPEGRPEPTRRLPWLLLAASAAAAGVLFKGPVAVALALLVLAPVTAAEWWIRGTGWRVRPAHLAVALVVFVLLAAPWYAAMTAEHGVAYLDRFFVGENLDRFATARYNAPRPLWYYAPIVFGGLLPWSPFMLLWGWGLAEAWRRRTIDVRTLRLGIWAAAPLAFYTLSIGKQPRYILPVLAPLAVLLARAITEALAATDRAAPHRLGGCAAAAGALVGVVGVLVARARPLLVDWPDVTILGLAAALLAAGVAIVGAALAHGARLGGGRPARALPALIALASVVAAVGAHVIVLASPGHAPVERMAALIAGQRPHDEPYGRYRVFDRNLVYYTGVPHVELPALEAARDFLRRPGRVLCVLRAEDAARLAADGLALRTLGEVRYLNTGNLNLRTLLDPDPSRYVQRVQLVANR